MKHIFAQLKAPAITLALVALLAQAVVGFSLTASPSAAAEAGFSLCITDLNTSDDAPKGPNSAGFCDCVMKGGSAILGAQTDAEQHRHLSALHTLAAIRTVNRQEPLGGQPPARGPPLS